MSFKLRILFHGLLGFVPHIKEGKPFRVLIIDGRAPGNSTFETGQLPHVSHIPAIRFDINNIDKENTSASYYVYHNIKDPTQKGMWTLNGDDLELRINGSPLPDEPLIVKSVGDEALSRVATMKKIYPDTDGVEVNDLCLDDNLVRLKDAGLAGRIKLKAGTVGAYPGKNNEYISSDEFAFTYSPNGYKERLISCIAYEKDVEAESIELFSKQRGQGLTFKPTNNEIVEITIENEPPHGVEAAKPGDGTIDIDFELVYRIAAKQPLQLRIPGQGSIVAASKPIICAEAIYNPSDKEKPIICSEVVYNSTSRD